MSSFYGFNLIKKYGKLGRGKEEEANGGMFVFERMFVEKIKIGIEINFSWKKERERRRREEENRASLIEGEKLMMAIMHVRIIIFDTYRAYRGAE